MKKKSFIPISVFCLLIFFLLQDASGQCPKNPSDLYDRKVILNKIIEALNDSVPDYKPQNPGFYITNEGRSGGFFIYDLFDPTNNDNAKNCIEFIDNHVYHFSPVFEYYSASHILVLENGNLKIFKSINCDDKGDSLTDVLSYLEPKLNNNKNKNEILTRVRNYRQYGRYLQWDYRTTYCRLSKPESFYKPSENSDLLYEGDYPIQEFSYILNDAIPGYKNFFYNGFYFERRTAVGFFVYDLTDPQNKQTSLDEGVRFIKDHVYHFAPIDLPWSFSFIAVLGKENMKVFKAINCERKGDSLKDVITYLNKKLKNNKNKDEILKRVKDYRKYGVYTSFNGLTTPQCQELVKSEK